MSPRPTFGPKDYEDPDVDEEDLQLRSDHPIVRDLSYERSRSRQVLDLYKGSLFDPGWEHRDDPSNEAPWPRDRLELYMKERARGPGYVADFLYNSRDLPVTVYGVLVNRGRGLEVAELELFRLDWGYFDTWGDFVGPDGPFDEKPDEDEDEDEQKDLDQPLITSDLLRRIPLGTIIARAQRSLAQDEWRQKGILVLMGADRSPEQMTPQETEALETAARAAAQTRRGRPPVSDEHLAAVAHAYLEQAAQGPGLTSRLATQFARPEATVRDWIMMSRRRGFLSPAVRGRRGAVPGPRLTAPGGDDNPVVPSGNGRL